MTTIERLDFRAGGWTGTMDQLAGYLAEG